MNTLSDAGAADDPRRFQRGRTADAVPDEFGAVQALPRESADDLVRIAGVTPGDRPDRHHGRGVRRYAADDPAFATLLTTAHRPESGRLAVRDDLAVLPGRTPS